MAGKGYLDLELWQFAEDVVKQSKKNLVNQDGMATKKLVKSISYRIKDNRIEFYMEEYGVYVDSGRDGRQKKQRGRGVFGKPNKPAFTPSAPIKKWIAVRNIRPRDLKTGQFIPATKSAINSMAFLIGRKHLEKGITPKLFFSNALRKFNKGFEDNLVEGVWQDFLERINN
jgi:hypothetical protein